MWNERRESSHHRGLTSSVAGIVREGRTHKEYEYSLVPTNDTETVRDGSNEPEDNRQQSEERQLFLISTDIDRRNYQRYLGPDMTEKGSRVTQYAASCAGNLSVFAGGVVMAWSSPILPMLKKDPPLSDNPLGRPINEEEGSWIGSLLAAGAAIGGFGAGYLTEKFGRKNALLFSAAPFILGWILVATAGNIAQLYIARIFFGMGVGIAYTALPMYVGEIAETSIRGALGSLMQLFISGGLIYGYVIGPYVSYLAFWIVCACVPVAFVFVFITMPESPHYFISRGRKEDAMKSLARLRGKTVNGVQQEVDEIQMTVEEAYRNQGSFMSLFRVRANSKALMLTSALVAFQQFTGINIVLFYTGDIFNSTGTALSSAISTIIVGCVMLIASCGTPIFVDRLGRKILLIISGIGQAATLIALGLFFYLKDVSKSDVSNLGWLPVTSLVIFIAAYSIGWGPLPWAVMGELFASDVKSRASSITVVFCWVLAFCITKFFTNIESALGTYTAFWIFAGFCIASVVFTIFLLPETKGKSLKEIQDILNGYVK
ncbi:facilitated trehalose transporter Tret1-2 homolog isoform X2 [Athalia rosae]|nr:facilitated trehalose transporter Tret1-2 homolog isoform X2 [Athalia rosae]